MSLGNSLFHARKQAGLSQEAAAEKLGVSRQTISKWETDETLPDIPSDQTALSPLPPEPGRAAGLCPPEVKELEQIV